MPLLLMCGLPASGKSRIAAAIADYFTKSGRQAVILDDSSVSAHFDKNDTYSNAMQEKDLRGEYLSAVQRKLSKTRVLIVDSMNYIKGYRYELYCAAKSAQTTFCVVYCTASPEMAMEWNNSSERAGSSYSASTIASLIERFETPDPTNRWDSPLISVAPSAELPFDAIDGALYKTKPAKPNKATLAMPVAPTNVSYDIDRLTGELVTAFSAQLKSQPTSDFVMLNIPSHVGSVKIRCKNESGLIPTFSDADLQRCRRDFVSQFRTKTHLSSTASSSDISNIVTLFVAFFESRLFPEFSGVVTSS